MEKKLQWINFLLIVGLYIAWTIKLMLSRSSYPQGELLILLIPAILFLIYFFILQKYLLSNNEENKRIKLASYINILAIILIVLFPLILNLLEKVIKVKAGTPFGTAIGEALILGAISITYLILVSIILAISLIYLIKGYSKSNISNKQKNSPTRNIFTTNLIYVFLINVGIIWSLFIKVYNFTYSFDLIFLTNLVSLVIYLIFLIMAILKKKENNGFFSKALYINLAIIYFIVINRILISGGFLIIRKFPNLLFLLLFVTSLIIFIIGYFKQTSIISKPKTL